MKTFPKFLALLLILPLFGQICSGPSAATQEASKPITLNIWGVFDNEDAYTKLFTAYRAKHPNVSFNYRKFRVEEYETQLVDAFAEDRGPDIFMVHNTSLNQWLTKLEPMPASTTMPYFSIEGTLKKETVVTLQTQKSLTSTDVSRLFPEVVGKDVVFPALVDQRTGTYTDRIYGLPLSVDTLALYYNKDLFNAAGIAETPTDWETFRNDVMKLTKIDYQGNITQSGAAMGGSANIERASDILAVLMMQGGAPMNSEDGRVTFNQIPQNYNKPSPPGAEALRYYTDFADSTKENYAWNRSMSGSFLAFATGRTAIFFGYNYHLPLLKAQAPRLNFDVIPLPQIDSEHPTNIANYWVLAVAKKSTKQNAAWNFIQYAADAQNVTSYLSATGKPTAQKSLIKVQNEDPILGVFAGQLLTAKNWYRGRDVDVAEQAMNELIDDALLNRYPDLKQALQAAVSKINQTIE
ncbi:MAG: extracellular solute-binding protein [bacterium]